MITGFTLIELMIVIVVVAVLAAIAMPSYRQYVLRTHRTEAKRTLLNVAVAQEKFYLQNNTYAGPSGARDCAARRARHLRHNRTRALRGGDHRGRCQRILGDGDGAGCSGGRHPLRLVRH